MNFGVQCKNYFQHNNPLTYNFVAPLSNRTLQYVPSNSVSTVVGWPIIVNHTCAFIDSFLFIITFPRYVMYVVFTELAL